MAAKQAIKILRDFFKEQEKGQKFNVALDDEHFIEEILNEPNPGVARAKEHGISITIAKGGTIYKVSSNDKEEAIGTVSSKEVQLTERRFSVQ